MSCNSTGGKLRLSPSSAAKKRASRGVHGDHYGRTRYQGWHREETRRGEHDRAPHASVADASTANATRLMIMVVLAGPPRRFEHPLRGVVPAPIRRRCDARSPSLHKRALAT